MVGNLWDRCEAPADETSHILCVGGHLLVEPPGEKVLVTAMMAQSPRLEQQGGLIVTVLWLEVTTKMYVSLSL